MKTIVCIHGMWSRPWVWDALRPLLEANGYQVRTLALPYHENDQRHQVRHIGKVPLQSYIDAVEYELSQYSQPPLIIGHSMGGLLAQVMAARGLASAAVLLAPAAPASVFALRLPVLRIFLRHLLCWGFWRKPIRLNWQEARWGVLNTLPEALARSIYEQLGPESGRAATDMAFWMFDKNRSAVVDAAKVSCPMLLLDAESDRITPVGQSIARRYKTCRYQKISQAGHWLLDGPALPEVAQHILAFFDEVSGA